MCLKVDLEEVARATTGRVIVEEVGERMRALTVSSSFGDSAQAHFEGFVEALGSGAGNTFPDHLDLLDLLDLLDRLDRLVRPDRPDRLAHPVLAVAAHSG